MGSKPARCWIFWSRGCSASFDTELHLALPMTGTSPAGQYLAAREWRLSRFVRRTRGRESIALTASVREPLRPVFCGYYARSQLLLQQPYRRA